jgi:N-acetylmuramoyl-L-alanine amidase
MRSIPTFVDLAAVLQTPLSRRARIYGRYAAGTIAVAGVALVFELGAGTAHAKSTTGAVYTVKPGDTLSEIALRNRISMSGIANANALNDIHKIVAGQKLVIPTSSSAASSTAAVVKPAKPKTTGVVAPKIPVSFGYPVTPSPGGPLPPGLASRPERSKLKPVFVQAAKEFNVSADLLQSLAWHESGWQNQVVSKGANAIGIGQLIPDTVTFINQELLKKNLDPNKPEHNIRMSAAFFRYLLNQTNNNVPMALGSYYQGLASVKSRGFYIDTEQYVRSVLAVQKAYF